MKTQAFRGARVKAGTKYAVLGLPAERTWIEYARRELREAGAPIGTPTG